MQFIDWANPTKEELREWAYEADSYAPEQDFNLICASDEYIDLVLEFASDDKCPKNVFFLQCLYIYAGDKGRSDSTLKIGLLDKAKENKNESIQKWLDRTKKLMEDPASYNYDDWGNARLATQ